MLVLGVEMRDFRTYSRAQMSVGPGLTVVHGLNGAGKSNLLEALYYGCTGRSPRTRNERELVSFGASATRVSVALEDAGERHELTVGFAAARAGEPAAKRMLCDGAPVERPSDAAFRPLISVFMPERLELIKGAPALRRAHLDQVVAALWPSRVANRREYSRVLAQRNALIARIRASGSGASSLAAWDRELAERALIVRDDRQEAVGLLARAFTARAAELGCAGPPTIEYRPRSRASGVEEFVQELQDRLAGDLERGFTGHGPHRDELAILRDGRELRVYGSQGEQRLALLALLLCERTVLTAQRGSIPLMLLDDVMSELDAGRRELLAAELAQAGQSLIATTDLSHVPGAGSPSVTRLHVSQGAVLQEARAA